MYYFTVSVMPLLMPPPLHLPVLLLQLLHLLQQLRRRVATAATSCCLHRGGGGGRARGRSIAFERASGLGQRCVHSRGHKVVVIVVVN